MKNFSLIYFEFPFQEETRNYSDRSKKNITYEEAFQYGSLNELLKVISNKEVKSLIGSDIEELNKYMTEIFKLDLSRRRDWTEFKERFYRRNIVVHNYGYPDSVYIAKTSLKGNKDDWIEISNRYLDASFIMFENYSKVITHFFYHKFRDL